MKTPERWRPSHVVPSLSLFLPGRPSNVKRFGRESVHRQTDGTENITLTADTGGKDRKPIQFWHQCGGPGGSKTLELQHRVTSTFATRVIHNIQTLYKASIICWIINANMLGKINLITLIWLIFPRPTHTSASKCCPLNDNLLPLYNPKLSNFTCLLVMYYSQMHWKLGI